MGSLPSQLFFWMNWLWCLCFVQEWMASAWVHPLGWDIWSPSSAGEQIHNRGKILLNPDSLSCPSLWNQAHRAVPLLHLAASCSGWVSGWMLLQWPVEDGHFPTVCANTRSPPPLTEDPKEKLPTYCLIPTALPTLCIFSAWLYTLAEQKRFPVHAGWLGLAHYPVPFLGQWWPVASSCLQYCSW